MRPPADSAMPKKIKEVMTYVITKYFWRGFI